MATKEELRAKLDELNAEQPPADAKKEELEEAVAKAEGSSEAGDEVEQKSAGDSTPFVADGKDSEASDPKNEDVKEGLSPEGQDALEEMGEDSEAAKEADLALDASGPLHLEAPHTREMTGAVSEEHAKEQEELLKDKPEDYVGSITEAGFSDSEEAEPKGAPKDNLSENDERDPEDVYEVRPEHVIDFPAPLGEREGEATGEEVKGDEVASGTPSGAFHSEPLGSASNAGARSRLFEQKAVFYTDGLSGGADHNHERAYVTPETLQSNNPEVREAGDESESDAFQDEKSDKDRKLAEDAKTRDDG